MFDILINQGNAEAKPYIHLKLIVETLQSIIHK